MYFFFLATEISGADKNCRQKFLVIKLVYIFVMLAVVVDKQHSRDWVRYVAASQKGCIVWKCTVTKLVLLPTIESPYVFLAMMSAINCVWQQWYGLLTVTFHFFLLELLLTRIPNHWWQHWHLVTPQVMEYTILQYK